jgi:dynein heavy chain
MGTPNDMSFASQSSDDYDGASKARVVSELTDAITRQLYGSICMGLFEKHKLIYSFIICTSIQRNATEIGEVHWNLFLRGAGIFSKTE